MRIVWHCEDRVGVAMAGPAIRAVELAGRLATRHSVLLVAPGATSLPPELRRRGGPAFAVAEHRSGSSLLPHVREAEVLVTQGFGFARSDLARLPRSLRLVLDLYDPVQFELLARLREAPSAEGSLHLALFRRRLSRLISRADHVLCASERQRVHWLGWLGAAGRLSPLLLENDPEGQSLLAVVPFGMPSKPPRGELFKLPVADGDTPVLWWGGLWDWMDPLTAIRAIARLRSGGLRVALVLPAGNRPDSEPMAAAAKALEQARGMGLWGTGVVQLSSWVPYEDRAAVLRGATVAVSCHRPSLEAALAFRTRLLDCVWAELPAVVSAGDELSARGAQEGWAAAVPAGDERAFATALHAMMRPDANVRARAAARACAASYSWDAAAAPLLDLLDRLPPHRQSRGILPDEMAGTGVAALVGVAGRKLASRVRRVLRRG